MTDIVFHIAGYGFGSGVAVRLEDGLAAVPGSIGEYSWNGGYGTGFFADPRPGSASPTA
jgi:hypothetical protein